MSPSTTTLLALLPLIAWRLYSRFRRMVGRQHLSGVRPWVTLVFFPALIVMLGFESRSHAGAMAWLAAGLAVGAILGVVGLRRTRFEATPEGFFYTPSAHLGIALSLLLVCRVIYRLVEIDAIESTAPGGMNDLARSSTTLAIFGMLAGYYMTYATGLVVWRLRVLREGPQRGEIEKGTS